LLYPMRSSGEGFVFELHDLPRTTQYVLRNGNDKSRGYTIKVVPRPRLKNLKVSVTPPAYTGEDAWTIEPLKHDAEVLKGSRVVVSSGVSGAKEAVVYKDKKLTAISLL